MAADPERRRWTFEQTAGFGVAALLAIGSLGGVLGPSTYARNSASIIAQSVGQDWVNLLTVSAMALLGRRTVGYVLTPMMLTLSVQMAVAILGMTLASIWMHQRVGVPVVALFALVAVVCGAILWFVMRRVRET